MKKCLILLAVLITGAMAACGGQKAPETAAQTEAQTESAAETTGVTETPAEAQTEGAAETETEAETVTQTESVMETETQAESVTETQAESVTETEAQTESVAETETEGSKVVTAADIRESQNAMCSAIDQAEAAFGVLVIDPEFEGSWPDVQAAIAFSGYAEKYPYLTSIGFEQYIETEGNGLICIIPRDMATTLSVNLVDEDLEVKKVLYRHEMAYPLLIRTAIDPEKPELLVSGVSGDYQATFYVMSDKGRLIMPNGGGVYDFTEE